MTNLNKMERRRTFRYPIQAQGIVQTDLKTLSTVTWAVQLQDISLEGFRFIASEALTPGATVSIRVPGYLEDPLQGLVAWCTPVANQFAIGVRLAPQNVWPNHVFNNIADGRVVAQTPSKITPSPRVFASRGESGVKKYHYQVPPSPSPSQDHLANTSFSSEEIIDNTPRCLERLGLTSDCTLEQVQQAYRFLVRRYHPDHGGDAKKFDEVNQAYLEAKKYFEERGHSNQLPQGRDRRRYRRLPAQIPCFLLMENSLESRPAELLDISLEGTKMRCRAALQKGEIVRFRIPTQKVVVLEGTVVRCSQQEDGAILAGIRLQGGAWPRELYAQILADYYPDS